MYRMFMHIMITLDIATRPFSVWTVRQISSRSRWRQQESTDGELLGRLVKTEPLNQSTKSSIILKDLTPDAVSTQHNSSNSSEYFLRAPFTFLLSFILHSNSYRLPFFTLQLTSCWKNMPHEKSWMHKGIVENITDISLVLIKKLSRFPRLIYPLSNHSSATEQHVIVANHSWKICT